MQNNKNTSINNRKMYFNDEMQMVLNTRISCYPSGSDLLKDAKIYIGYSNERQDYADQLYDYVILQKDDKGLFFVQANDDFLKAQYGALVINDHVSRIKFTPSYYLDGDYAVSKDKTEVFIDNHKTFFGGVKEENKQNNDNQSENNIIFDDNTVVENNINQNMNDYNENFNNINYNNDLNNMNSTQFTPNKFQMNNTDNFINKNKNTNIIINNRLNLGNNKDISNNVNNMNNINNINNMSQTMYNYNQNSQANNINFSNNNGIVNQDDSEDEELRVVLEKSKLEYEAKKTAMEKYKDDYLNDNGEAMTAKGQEAIDNAKKEDLPFDYYVSGDHRHIKYQTKVFNKHGKGGGKGSGE